MQKPNGEFVFSFRDRGADQYLGGATSEGNEGNDWTAEGSTYGLDGDGNEVSGRYITTGDNVQVTLDGQNLEFERDFTFQDGVTANGNGVHKQGSFAGIAYVPGADYIVGNQLDANEYNQLGLRVWNAADGTINDRFPDDPAKSAIDLTGNFGKNAGLADVEVLVREADQQIGNRIWIDSDHDGIQDADEQPVGGVTVNLYGADGELVASTTTNALGEYYFDTDDGVLPLTDYEVRIDPSAFEEDGPLEGYTPTLPDVGDDGIDSDGIVQDDGTVLAAITSPPYGANDLSIDFGVAPLVSIGDYLWIDADGDGTQDDTDVVPDGTEVILYAADGTTEVARTTTTDGYYSFTDLLPETEYVVHFPPTITVDGRTHVLTEQGDEPAASDDSNADPATGDAPVTTPAFEQGVTRNSGEPGEADDPTIDAGYLERLVSIGDYVWFDENGDGVQDPGEDPIADVVVSLLDGDGEPVLDEDGEPVTATTGPDGYYAFPDLPTNEDYIVEFPTTVVVDGHTYRLTPQGADPEAGNDSNPDPATGRAPVTTPEDGQNLTDPDDADDPTIDAGYSGLDEVLVSIGDYVWLDADGDGMQDDSELPVGGITVTLLDANGEEVTTAQTSPEGYYAFPDLIPGAEYTVRFPTTVTVDGQAYILTVPGGDAGEPGDSNPNAAGDAPVTAPTSGQNLTGPDQADDPTIDAGYRPVVSIGDYVWLDEDGDGVQDAGEKPAPHTPVVLYDRDGNKVAETETDEDGYYAFPNLTPGEEYEVEFPKTITVDGKTHPLTPANQGADDAADSDVDPSTGRIRFTAPTSGLNLTDPGQADDPTFDAGYSTLPGVVPPADGGLAITGGALPAIAGGLAAIMLMAGAALLGMATLRRRQIQG